MSDTNYNESMRGRAFNDRGEFDYQWEEITFQDEVDKANAVETLIEDCRKNLKD